MALPLYQLYLLTKNVIRWKQTDQGVFLLSLPLMLFAYLALFIN
ncbi:hypothetical protein SAMN05518847_109126 [Paenibacillus sp. OV219]|nr:hypothetical protein SAMN05518847_109126 [Paenibacillus sp. OV219]